MVATSLERDETGPYRLSADLLQMAKPMTHEAVLAETGGKNENGSHFLEFPIEARKGEWVLVTMRSKMFDSQLTLLGPDGSVVAENDDWKEGILDSRIFVRIGTSGEHRIVASSIEPGTTGTFILEVAHSLEEER